MTDHDFDDALLSGWVDGELTQADDQRVRLHIESCDRCRKAVDELTTIRRETMSTDFRVPRDTQWDERPRSALSALFQGLGWLTYALWFVGVIGFTVWQATSESESIRFESLIGFGSLLAFVLIVLSALIDRSKTMKDDPYRKVQK